MAGDLTIPCGVDIMADTERSGKKNDGTMTHFFVCSREHKRSSFCLWAPPARATSWGRGEGGGRGVREGGGGGFCVGWGIVVIVDGNEWNN